MNGGSALRAISGLAVYGRVFFATGHTLEAAWVNAGSNFSMKTVFSDGFRAGVLLNREREF